MHRLHTEGRQVLLFLRILRRFLGIPLLDQRPITTASGLKSAPCIIALSSKIQCRRGLIPPSLSFQFFGLLPFCLRNSFLLLLFAVPKIIHLFFSLLLTDKSEPLSFLVPNSFLSFFLHFFPFLSY